MTPIEVGFSVVLLVVAAVVVGLAFQIRSIAREVRAEGRASDGRQVALLARIDQRDAATIEALREMIEGRRAAAAATLREAEAIPKPHRHVWRYASSEQTNGERVTFYRCSLEACREVLRVGADDPAPEGVG